MPARRCWPAFAAGQHRPASRRRHFASLVLTLSVARICRASDGVPDENNKAATSRSPAVQPDRPVFVNSMSEFFHDDVPLEFIQRVFEVMETAHWHQFQVLTKRAVRLSMLSPHLSWSDNVWMGVSVEDANYLWRVDHLRHSEARVKFLSLEPLLGPMPDIDLDRIHWVIVGGESSPRARPMLETWVTQIRDRCVGAGVPFFFKQWGGIWKKRAGRLLQGRTER
jgi:protein gp37